MKGKKVKNVRERNGNNRVCVSVRVCVCDCGGQRFFKQLKKKPFILERRIPDRTLVSSTRATAGALLETDNVTISHFLEFLSMRIVYRLCKIV